MTINHLTKVKNRGLETGKPTRSESLYSKQIFNRIQLCHAHSESSDAGFVHARVWSACQKRCVWMHACACVGKQMRWWGRAQRTLMLNLGKGTQGHNVWRTSLAGLILSWGGNGNCMRKREIVEQPTCHPSFKNGCEKNVELNKNRLCL